jgi:prepilin-type N-terminal cleavage/methylation domain-containing protein
VKKAAKATMQTSTAPMRTDVYMCKCVDTQMCKCTVLIHPSTHSRARGFTLTELVVVIVIISLFVLLASTRLSSLLTSHSFKAQVQDFVSAMQMATSAAAETGRRYEVIVDIGQQSYMLREITSPDLSEVLEEEIIIENDFSDNCRVIYVLFDDGDYTNEGRAKFRAGHSGWQYGGKIALLDSNGQEYSVIVNRLNGIVELKKGYVGFLVPKFKDDVPF